MHGVGRDVSVAVSIIDVNHKEIVDVLHVGSNLSLSKAVRDRKAHKYVTRGSVVQDLVVDVFIQTVLAIGPLDLNLQ